MNDAIGGYFQLELSSKLNTLHSKSIFLNSARNCLEYILLANPYHKIYLPYFTCEVLLEPILKLGLIYEFYDVDDRLEAIIDFDEIEVNSVVLVTNYFGLKTSYINSLQKHKDKLIVDNAQALFAPPITDINTFYSPRKFVGVSDGGFLYSNIIIDRKLEYDLSYDRMSHLLKRLEKGAEFAYEDFVINDNSLVNNDLKFMSNLTKCIFQSIDLEVVCSMRKENFLYLHSKLEHLNSLEINIEIEDVPLVYPLRIKNSKVIKKQLLKHRIYCATYWPNVLEWCDKYQNAYSLTNEIIALPIDQRYNLKQMDEILLIINKCTNEH